MLSDSVPPYYTDGPIRKKSHGSEEFLRSYDYQLGDLQKGAIWRKGSVTFHGASHPMYAPRFVGVNSNVNKCRPTGRSSAQSPRPRTLPSKEHSPTRPATRENV